MNSYIPIIALLLTLTLTHAQEERPNFDPTTDILIAQFDSKPDPDDINAQAALGCLLAHESLAGVNYYAVAGAYGTQGEKYKFIPSPQLFNMAFGPENEKWTDAYNDRPASVQRIKDKVLPILQNGGKVWVQEAGQSDVTADWLVALVDAGVAPQTIKEQVIVVQHSHFNERATTPHKLAYVKDRTRWTAIDDGNKDPGTGEDRGPDTPNYKTYETQHLTAAKTSPNQKAAALWIESERVILENGYYPKYSPTWQGGLDFSDCVENIWIFNIQNANSVEEFFKNYVLNTPKDQSK